jgi:hypothetical protein
MGLENAVTKGLNASLGFCVGCARLPREEKLALAV